MHNIKKAISNVNLGSNNNSVVMMVVVPMISSLCNTAVGEGINMVKYVLAKFKILMSLLVIAFYKKVWTGDQKKVYVLLYKNSAGYRKTLPTYTKYGKALLWYINKYKHINTSNVSRVVDEDYTEKGYNDKVLSNHNKDIMGNIVPYFDIELVENLPQDQILTKNRNYDPKDVSFDVKFKRNNPMYLGDDIYLDIFSLDINDHCYFVLSSSVKNSTELSAYMENVHEKFQYEISKVKIVPKMLIYKKTNKNEMKCSSYDLDKTQDFNNLFFDFKEDILSDIELLKDIEYHKKYGLKRKLGYLLHGKPGSGKTCIVTAIANKLHRSIVYIPISQITNNQELEDLIYKRVYNGVKYDLDEVVFCFDEIDSSSALIKNPKIEDVIEEDAKIAKKNKHIMMQASDNVKNVVEKIQDAIKSSDNSMLSSYELSDEDNIMIEKIDVGLLLSLLDGNADQDGMIVIATANYIKNIDPALYRDGRLKLIECNYMSKNNIIEMLEFYGYDTKSASDSTMSKIPDDASVQSLTIKTTVIKCLRNDKSLEYVIDCILDLFNQ
jgi:hypothetical protein